MPSSSPWPDLSYARFGPTGQSLHMWSQIVGKFRLAQTPWINHSWQATSYVGARGLGSSLIPGAPNAFEVNFDFIDHRLDILSSDGMRDGFALEAMSVADFYAAFRETLERIGAPADIHGAPNEVPDATPFRERTDPGAYSPEAAADFHRALVSIDAVFKRFRTAFLGKVSPVHFFWGSFDLAVTRFSGRRAPLHPGGFPSLPDEVTREAYSHEVSSAGFWPGGLGPDGAPQEAIFYSYAYPTPDGFSKKPAGAPAGRYDEGLGEFVLPYAAIRDAAAPEDDLMAFLQATYAAAADLAEWDRSELECGLGRPGVPRAL
ncbi:MAG: DUF5996 family protein [Pseudomonadota bacterium]